MSEENVDTVRRLVEAFNEGGFASPAAVSLLDEAFLFEEPPEQPAPGVARDRDAAVRMFTDFDAAWDHHHSELEEVRALDDERVLMLSVERFRGRDGIEVNQPCGTIFTLRGGKVTRMQSFWERNSALKAAGLPG